VTGEGDAGRGTETRSVGTCVDAALIRLERRTKQRGSEVRSAMVKKRPETADDCAALSDAEVVIIGQDYGAHFSVTAQSEMTRRLITALLESKASSDRAASRLLMALTAVLAADAVARLL
jgi:hypothetical protein